MSGEIDLSVESLREHAAAVRTLMAELAGATESAGDTLDLKTFGLACIEPAQILQLWIQRATSYLRTATAAGNDIAGSLTGMADSYEQYENDTAQSFTAVGTSLGGGS